MATGELCGAIGFKTEGDEEVGNYFVQDADCGGERLRDVAMGVEKKLDWYER